MRVERPQGAEKGPVARRRPKAGHEAYSLYVECPVEGANEANGPLSAACYRCLARNSIVRVRARAALGAW